MSSQSNIRLTTGTLVNAADGVIYSNVGVGGSRRIFSQVDNQGTINVYANLTLGVSGTPFVNSGDFDMFGTTAQVLASSFTNTETGTINGSGTINLVGSPLLNNGTIEVTDTAAARMTIQGSLTQTATGHVAVRIFSDGTASAFDQLVVTGAATLAGELNVIRANEYRPPVGETLPVVTFASRTGTFDTVTGLVQGMRQVLEPLYNPTNASLLTIVAAIQPNQPQFGSNLGQATITVVGDNFTSAAVVKLVSGTTQRTATSVLFQDRTTLFATFDLIGLAVGQYDIRVEDGGTIFTLAQPYTVNSDPKGHLETVLITSPSIRQGREGTIRVEYVNAGNTDIQAPLLELKASNAVLKLLGEDSFGNSSRDFLAINPSGPAGILSPSAGGVIHFRLQFHFEHKLLARSTSN